MNPSGEPSPVRIPILFKEDEADAAVDIANAFVIARAAQVHWARIPMARRLELIREFRRLIAGNAIYLADASAAARSRPAAESLTAEVLPLAEACRFLERESTVLLAPRRLGKRGLPLWLTGVRSEVHREPLGVVLIIGPGNYPLLLPGVQLIQALVAGNAVVLKPGVGGSAAARALIELVIRAGFDSHLVTLFPESSAAARAAIAARPDKVLFTGSAATGEKILSQLAPQLIPATMELSGCDAVVVRADADLDLTIKALTFGLNLNAGATCMAPKRVFVARSVATELEGRLAKAFKLGARSEAVPTAAADKESIVAAIATERLRPLLDDALSRGAHFIAGGVTPDGLVRLPVILGGVHPASRLLREDVFFPVLCLVTVADDAEAVTRANDCPFALAASIFSQDEAAAQKLAAQINAGIVTINDLVVPSADARVPFGGRGRSGFGVTRGAEGLLELTTPKVITRSRGSFRPAFDAPRSGDLEMFQAYLTLTHGRGFKLRLRALIALIRTLSRRGKSSPRD